MGRPANFDINAAHPLARNLIFAGLGSHRQHRKYFDNGFQHRHGNFVNINQSTNWVWSRELGRFVLYFNGSNNYIANIPYLINKPPITIAGWFKTSTNSVRQSICGSNESIFGRDTIYLHLAGDLVNTPIRFAYYDANAGKLASAVTTTGFSTNIWQHACGIWLPNGKAEVYLNGGNKGVETVNAITTLIVDNTSIGNRVYDATTSYYMNGYLADIMIWNRVLSPIELQILIDKHDYTLGGLIV